MNLAIKLALTTVLGLSIQANANLAEAPKQQAPSKSFTEILEKFKQAKDGVTSTVTKEDMKVAAKKPAIQKVADTDYDEINVLQNKLQEADAYPSDKRDELSKHSCTNGVTCTAYYKQLQLEAGWYDALQAGYAKEGCQPNKKKVLLSNEEAIYYQVVDPMLAKDEVKITRSGIRLADLTQNKRVLANSEYSEDVCFAYARDIWTSFAQHKTKKLKIKRIEY